MKKLLQKAMVFSLSAAMLVGTPLTASAAPLNSVYQVTDRWGETSKQENSSDTRTGTVTGSETNSGVLEADSVIEGISLDETNVTIEMGAYDPAELKTEVLTASIDWQDESKKDPELEKTLLQGLKWETGDRDIIALKAMGEGNREKALNNRMTLVAKAGGTTTVTVRLDSEKYNIHYSATATVTVEQYASKLSFSEELGKDAYEGATLKLDDYLVREPISATDKVTYVLKSQGKDTKATLKNGVLTLKLKQKYTEGKDYKVTLVAVGKNVKSEDTEIIIKKAVPATNVTITCKELTISNKKADWLVNQKGAEIKFGVDLDPKEGCTDKVTWTSQKPAVVALKYNDAKDGSKGVTLTAKGVGSSKITAQAGKKKATVTVTVRANLTGIEITTESGTLYSGQTIQLTADQKFADKGVDNFTDAGLNWVFDGGEGSTSDQNKRINAMKKVASLNAKTGALTIKPDIGVNGAPVDHTIRIKAQNAKTIGKATDSEYKKAKKLDSTNKVEFSLEQINVTKITVYSNMAETANNKIIAMADLDRKGNPKDEKNSADVKKNNTVEIANGISRTYRVAVEAVDKDGNPIDSTEAAKVLSWSSNNTKYASASVNGNGSGTVSAIKKGKPTITISSATKKGSKYTTIKATFKVNVTVPTKSITLSVKNTGIGWKNGNQNVKVTAKLDKGTTSKASAIVWTAKGETKDSEPITVTTTDVKKGTLKLTKGKYNVGDVYTVTAKLPGTGVQTSIKVKIVEPTSKVQIVQSAESNEKFKSNKTQLFLADDEPLPLVTKVQKKGESTWVIPTEDNDRAVVTYTVKGDCVQLVGDQVKAVKTGKATITAKTSDGKTAKLTVEVKEGSRPASN